LSRLAPIVIWSSKTSKLIAPKLDASHAR